MRFIPLFFVFTLPLVGCGKDDPIAPTVSITSPGENERYYAEEKILFEGLVADDAASPGELSVVWKSDVDGELDWANEPDSKGQLLGYGMLSEGQHAISLTATDTDGLIGRDSLLVEVGPPNSAPSCEITAPPEGTATNEGDVLTLVATVGDVDIGPEALAVSWSSDVDGELGESTASLEGIASLEIATLSMGDHGITLTVADEMGLECKAQVSHKIGQAPRLTWQWPDADAVLSSENPGYAHVNVDDDFHAAADLAVSWESSIDGALTPDPIDDFGNSMRDLDDLSLGTHILTATATNPDNLTGTASLEFTINGVPESPSVSISPDPAYTGDILVAIVSEGADPEGDAQTLKYQWSKDGILQTDYTGDAVPSAATTKHEVWTIRVTPSDAYGAGLLGQAELTVSNSLPVVSTVAITPSNPSVSDALVCSYGYGDDDGDGDESQIAWTIDGSVVGTGAKLDANVASKGDTVLCTVTANDGEEDGNSESDSVTILNSDPVVSTVTISPSTGVTTSSSLSCSVTATDADGESLTEDYTWQNGSTTLGTGSSLSLTNATSSPTDSISCSVTVTDGSGSTASGSASVTVENTLPEIASVSISPTDPTVSDTVTCSASASDADGDTPTLSYNWTSGSSSVGTSSSLDLSGTSLVKGDGLSCEVTATDDQGDTAVELASVSIVNSVPEVSAVSISPSSPTVTDTLTCSYSFLDDDNDADASSVTWTVGSSTVGTGSTLAAGSVAKNETVTCSVTPNDGTDTGTAASDAVTVVNTPPVVSSVAIGPSSPTVSDALTCSYSFADKDGDADASSVTWTVGSSTVGTGSTLAAGTATKGETAVCTVEANDGEDVGNTDAVGRTIQNSPPSAPGVSISPSAPVSQTDDVLCSIDTESTDADGDSVSYTIAWEVEGASWTGSTSTTTESGDTISATELVYDETWTCSVTPNDGTISGTAGEDSVTVVCQDADGDGYADESCGGTDCNDSDADFFPTDSDGDGIEDFCGWIDLSAGSGHTCAVKSSGTVECWGYDNYGQATPPSGTFESVSAGDLHTCAVDSSGTVECWGLDNYGQSTPPSGTFESVNSSWFNTCGLLTTGVVDCWGRDDKGQSTAPSGTFVSVSADSSHACGLNTSGTVECWGDDSYGQATPPSDTFESVSAGNSHSCGVLSDGTLDCWGRNQDGQSTPPSGTFQSVDSDNHSCGVNTSGGVECWGWDGWGQSTPPTGTFVRVSAGFRHTCGVLADGSLTCWGDDGYGQATPPSGP